MGMNTDDLAGCIEDHLKITWDRVNRCTRDYDYYIRKAKKHMALWEERRRTLMRS